MAVTTDAKAEVRDFWNRSSCGEVYAIGRSEQEYYESESAARYELEPYILDFARFAEGGGKDVLEIGVGMGADHVMWAKSGPRSLTGIDLTPRAIEHTSRRLAIYGLTSDLRVGDGEKLRFEENSFDIIYSWGVLHHSPDTPAAIDEVYRVLRPGGTARIMVYHTYSLVGYMLWLRYGWRFGGPFQSLRNVYASHLESPGTKAYTPEQASRLFPQFSDVNVRVQLSHGDLLEGVVGTRHGGRAMAVAKHLWPRPLLRRFFRNHGLYLLIDARK